MDDNQCVTNLPFKILTEKETERYLGYSFNKSGLVYELKNKLKDLIGLLKNGNNAV
jgi:hypothetical protein